MKRLLAMVFLAGFFTLGSFHSYGRSSIVEIGLLSRTKSTTIIITPLSVSYSVLVDDSVIYTLSNKDLLHVSWKKGQLELKTLNGLLGHFSNIQLQPQGKNGSFKLKPVMPYGHTRAYDDALNISVLGDRLQVISEVNIDKYVAGVVKSEVGTNEGMELYKVQAIICRTYALSNFRKHEDEDFQLCDNVHCQVYHGRCDQADPLTGLSYAASGDILKAALTTTGMVLVDTTLELITASFHSNCGGQTVNSEDVWMLPKIYLKSVKDPYCVSRRNARWEREISQDKWLGYFKRVYNYPIEDAKSKERALNFTQTSRAPYFQNNHQIMLKDVRTAWRLKSAFFSTSEAGGKVLIQGRGYGHGVGLCQEGSMEMAERGKNYKDILNFYYTNVALIDIASLRFLLK